MNVLKILPPTKHAHNTNSGVFYIQHNLNDKVCIPMFQLEYTKISILKNKFLPDTSFMFTITKNMEQILHNYYQHIKNISNHLGGNIKHVNIPDGVIFIDEKYINKKYFHFIKTLVKYNTDINSDYLYILIKPVLIYERRRIIERQIILKFELVHVKKI